MKKKSQLFAKETSETSVYLNWTKCVTHEVKKKNSQFGAEGIRQIGARDAKAKCGKVARMSIGKTLHQKKQTHEQKLSGQHYIKVYNVKMVDCGQKLKLTCTALQGEL